jgi:hypothetical protein
LKKTFTTLLCCFALFITDNLYSQGLTIGAYSGVNISDIHGNNTNGKWRFMTGPVLGVSADYNLKRWFGLSTGVRYLSIYYEHRDYNSGIYYYPTYGPSSHWDPLWSSSIWQPPYPVKYDFNMLNIPMQLKLTIPSTPDLYIAAGTYWSFTTSKPEYMEGGKKDFGYIFNAGISAPLGDVFKANISTGYSTGRKQFMSYKHGYYEVTLGIAYTGFLNYNRTQKRDSTSRIELLYFAGINLAWNGKGSYGENPGVKAGFIIDIPIGRTAAFRTGLSFEQDGYSLTDSTDHFFAVKSDYNASYHADTKVTIDYLIIPATFKFNLGTKTPVHVNLGPYAALKLNARVIGEAISVMNYGSTYTRTQVTVFDDITGLFEGSDFGLTAGAGISLPFFGKYRSEAGVSYRAGLKNVFEPEGSNNQYSGIEVRNRSLAFHFGILIPVKK